MEEFVNELNELDEASLHVVVDLLKQKRTTNLLFKNFEEINKGFRFIKMINKRDDKKKKKKGRYN